MTRSRSSAKTAGTRFERLVADYLADAVDDRIDRRPRTGVQDRGDISGVRLAGRRLVLECKDVARTALPQWTEEARQEAANDGALAGLFVHKRRGRGGARAVRGPGGPDLAGVQCDRAGRARGP